MRILVISDSHGDAAAIRRALIAQPQARALIFLGDGLRDLSGLAALPVYAVCGNCDFGCDEPLVRDEFLGGRHLLLCHGHTYAVKSGLYTLSCAARERGAAVALFGHTHTPLTDYDDGLHLFNPGSIHGYGGTYGTLDISDAGIVTNVIKCP